MAKPGERYVFNILALWRNAVSSDMHQNSLREAVHPGAISLTVRAENVKKKSRKRQRFTILWQRSRSNLVEMPSECRQADGSIMWLGLVSDRFSE